MSSLIKVVHYDPNWPRIFEKEAQQIKQALGSNCLEVHHIGSTSILGLSAKPVVDILPVVKDIRAVDYFAKKMEEIGYRARGEFGIPFRRFFQKGFPEPTCNIHVYELDDSEIDMYLKFRNWMRENPVDALDYQNLKLKLAAKYPHDILKYCLGKDAFVASIVAKTGFSGNRMVQAFTEREWTTAHTLHRQYFEKHNLPFSKINCSDEGHIHFILYQNSEAVGYAYLEMFSDNECNLHMLMIDLKKVSKNLEGAFLEKCERWLKHNNIKKIRVLCPLQLDKYYSHHGYRPGVEAEDNVAYREWSKLLD